MNLCSYLITPNTYVCIHCGGANEPCCPNAGCNNSTLVCDTLGGPSTCKPCGLTGNPCCHGASPCSATGACCSLDVDPGGRCVAPGSSCSTLVGAGAGTCVKGVCECGQENEPCCTTNPVCANPADQCMKGQLTSTCVPCGGPGKPCCPINRCANGGCCVYDYAFGSLCVASGATCQTSPPATCNAGACGTCGVVGQSCCVSPENVCTAPNTYCTSRETSATCQSCGGSGQACCGNDSTVTYGTICNGGLTCSSTTGGTCQP